MYIKSFSYFQLFLIPRAFPALFFVTINILILIGKLSPEQAVTERLNCMTAAYKIHDKEELKNVVMREAIGGNKDFLAGLNDALANGAAKDLYKKK